MAPELRAADLEAVRDQLGREPTTTFDVVARCATGHPLVIRNQPARRPRRAVPDHVLAHLPRGREGGVAAGVRRLRSPSSTSVSTPMPASATAVERAHAEAAEERERLSPGSRDWGGRGRHAARPEVPARPLREPSRGWGRRGRGMGGRAHRADPRRGAARRTHRGDRPGHPLVPAARRGAGARRRDPRARRGHDHHEARAGRGRDGRARPRAPWCAPRRSSPATAVARGRSARTRIRVAATSAVRDASNRDVFVAMVLTPCRGGAAR